MSAPRDALEYRRPLGGMAPEAARMLSAYLAEHPEVSNVHAGEFDVLHATVTEPDGIRYLQAYTAEALLAKLKRLHQRPPPDG